MSKEHDMKQAYYIDFPLVAYATRLVVADSVDEAHEIADKLCESSRFFDEHILQSVVYDFDVDYISDNLEKPEVVLYGGDVEEVIDDHRYMSKEDLEDYIDLEA